jgi:hypothetical protein
MTEKIACAVCGAMILTTTAASNEGMCMPCKRGDRSNIEAAKLRHAERKKALANPDPGTLHWRWLVDQVELSPSGFADLSRENRHYFAACLLEGEVYNGGFDQYFHSSAADYCADALHALEEIGAAECRRILLAAKEVAFGTGDLPASQKARARLLKKMGPTQEQALEEFDRSFGQAAGVLRESMVQYALKHGLYDDFDTAGA